MITEKRSEVVDARRPGWAPPTVAVPRRLRFERFNQTVDRFLPYLLVLPAAVLTGVFILVPLAQTIWISFTLGAYTDQQHFAGLTVYQEALQETGLPFAIRNALVWGASAMVLAPALGLVSAALVEDGPARPKALFRFVFFSPYLFSLAVAGAIFTRVYDPSYGFIASLLKLIGFGDLKLQWLGDPHLALTAALVVFLWHEVPFCFLVFSAAIRQIDRNLYDAANVDGAWGLQTFVHITVPSLRTVTTMVVMIMLLVGLIPFAVVYALTFPALGAPSYATEIIPTMIFKLGLLGTNYEEAAALSVLLLVAIVGITLGLNKVREWQLAR